MNTGTTGAAGEEVAEASALAPVTSSERISHIDSLRGVAVLGILVMNIYAFAMPFVAYQNPLVYGGTEWFNLGTWFLTHIFFDQKFLAIFAVLFGAGLILMKERADASGRRYAGVWYRRNAWLLLIGAAHGYLLWFGDILFHYALMGMLVFLFRNLRPRTLIIIACIQLLIGMMTSVTVGTQMHQLQMRGAEVQVLVDAGEALTAEQQEILAQWRQMSIFMKLPAEQVEDDTAAYRGGYRDIVQYRAPTVLMMQTLGTIFLIWRVGGLMLLGMALMKLGVLSGARSDGFYRRMMLTGYGLGLPVMLFSSWLLSANQWDMLWMFQYGMLVNYFGSLAVAAGHVALVMTVVNRGLFAGLMTRFAAVGRMAFTNYLMHSLVMTTLFYGYGLGLYGQIPRALQMAFVAGMLGFQLWFSPFWLRRFRFGPMEWLWRSLTHWQRQPMRHEAA